MASEYLGVWDGTTFYPRGTVVTGSDDAPYQATHDSLGEDPIDGNPPWADISAIPLELIGDADPTDELNAAIGSSFIVRDTGIFFKTDDTDADWVEFVAPS